jgi:hypothetical protein
VSSLYSVCRPLSYLHSLKPSPHIPLYTTCGLDHQDTILNTLQCTHDHYTTHSLPYVQFNPQSLYALPVDSRVCVTHLSIYNHLYTLAHHHTVTLLDMPITSSVVNVTIHSTVPSRNLSSNAPDLPYPLTLLPPVSSLTHPPNTRLLSSQICEELMPQPVHPCVVCSLISQKERFHCVLLCVSHHSLSPQIPAPLSQVCVRRHIIILSSFSTIPSLTLHSSVEFQFLFLCLSTALHAKTSLCDVHLSMYRCLAIY